MTSARHHAAAAALCALLAVSVTPAQSQKAARSGRHPLVLTSTLTFDWNKGPQGWEATNDFRLDGEFTKLGGPVDGAAWVTENPRARQTYTEGAYADSEGYPSKYPGPNLLVSPWIDLSRMRGTAVSVSFRQSIAVEPGWDGSWMEYTTDGAHWRHLGKLNDLNGVNWYSTAAYKNAGSGTGNPPDTATMKLKPYNLYGPGSSNPGLPFGWWTSDGDRSGAGEPEGPAGWKRCELKITASDYPDIFAARSVRFRYVAFSDAATSSIEDSLGTHPLGGWAVDDFTISAEAKK
jgi:hypothetical protein